MSNSGRSRKGAALAAIVGLALALFAALPAYAGPGPLGAAASRQPRASAAASSRQHVPSPAARRAVAADRAASARARATHKPVIVAANTTEVSQTTANPDGTFTYNDFALPVRVSQYGHWAAVSPRLHRVGGRLEPAAVPSAISLSAGGTGPLAMLTSLAGGTLTLPAPAKKMPAPLVSGATATYRDISPGISLQLTVSPQGGLTETLQIVSRAAATSPAARRLALGLAGGHGLHLTAGAHGGISAAAGRLAEFTSSPAQLISGTARPATPGSHARSISTAPGQSVRPVATGPGGALTLRTAPASGYPAQITWSYTPEILMPATGSSATRSTGLKPAESCIGTSCTGTEYSYDCEGSTGEPMCTDLPSFDETEGSTGTCSTYTNYDTQQPESGAVKGGDGTTIYGNGTGWQDYGGDCNDEMYDAYYEYALTGLTSSAMTINSATIYATLTGSAEIAPDATEESSCSNDTWPLTLYSVQNINSGTDGASPPKVNNEVDSISAGLGPNPSDVCTNVALKFKVTSLMDTAISDGWKNMSTSIEGDTSTSSTDYGFSRIGDNPDLQANFDLPPSTPYDATINSTSCYSGGFTSSTPWINATSAELEADTTVSISGESAAGAYITDDYTIDDGTLVTTAYQPPESDGTTVEFPSYNWTGLQSGNQYEWLVNAQTDGDGEADANGPIYANTPLLCYWSVDTTPPQLTSVSSTAFPQDGGGQYGGTTGTFTFTGNDPVPTAGNCDANPNPCVASGVKEFEYSLNQPIPAGTVSDTPTQGTVTVAANSGGSSVSGTASIDVADWGENILYVEAIDNAGNPSAVWDYYFTAPWNPSSKATPGDVDGDGIPDLLAATSASTSALDLFPGTSASAVNFSSTAQASQAGDSPDQDDDWNQFDITHRGSISATNVDDLFALGGNNLYLMLNNKTSTDQYTTSNNVTDPECSTSYDASNNCTGYLYNSSVTDEWQTTNTSNSADVVSQILAVGPSAALGNSGNTNMVAVEDGELYFFTGQGGGQFGTGLNWQAGDTPGPVLIGSSAGSGSSGTTNWADMTLLAPGTEGPPGTITIWARDNNTADTTYGDIYSYTISFTNGIASLSSSGPVTATGGTLLEYATGSNAGQPVNIPASTYPAIATPGNANGPASIYAINTNGDVDEYTGYQYSGIPTASTPQELLQQQAQIATVPAGSITQLS